MAIDEQERRANSVSLPKPAITFITSVAVVLLGWGGSVLFTQSSEIVRLDQRVKFLEAFGPATGPRFTERDGERLRDRIKAVEQWRYSHSEWGGRIVGKWEQQIAELQRRLQALENGDLKDNAQTH